MSVDFCSVAPFSLSLQLTLENEMKDKDEAYKVKCESEEKLKQEIESLNITKSELTVSICFIPALGAVYMFRH